MTLLAMIQQTTDSPIAPWVSVLFSEAVKYAFAALIGFVLSNLTIGRKLKGTETRIMEKIEENERNLNDRTTKLEHEMWGPQGNDGMRVELRKTTETVNTILNATSRVETTLKMLVRLRAGENT